MALGSNRGEQSRKTDLIVKIQLNRLSKGLSAKAVKVSTHGYRRKQVAELRAILENETS